MRLPILVSNYAIEFTRCDCIVVSTNNVCIELQLLSIDPLRAINYISLSVQHSMQMNAFYGLGLTSSGGEGKTLRKRNRAVVSFLWIFMWFLCAPVLLWDIVLRYSETLDSAHGCAISNLSKWNAHFAHLCLSLSLSFQHPLCIVIYSCLS